MAEMISGITGGLQGSLNGMLNKGSAWLDSIFPPEKRNELMAKISKFATEKPMMASFILSHLALSGVPMGLFIIMTITIVIFSIVAALILAVLAAVIFSVVCVGFALIILLPTLFITTAAASFIWLWGLGAYYILKWFNKKEIPGIHKPMGEGMDGELGLDALTGDKAPPPSEKDSGQANGHAANGSANGHAKEGKKEGGTGKIPGRDKLEGVGKSTGIDVNNPKEAADVGKIAGKTGNVSQATNAVSGVKGGLGL
ncbi:MAG: hypothetical protein Q9219_005660 [cf. Caloplaca sp. 3 TL-2023]